MAGYGTSIYPPLSSNRQTTATDSVDRFVSKQTGEVIMDEEKRVYIDLETVGLLREAFDEAWACLRPDQQATMLKTPLAE